jgi:uncharacterized membrane protein required for colicin V production
MEILTRINWVDVLVVILILRMSYVAFSSGLSHEIFPFFGVLAVFALSLRYYKPLAAAISGNLGGIPSEISDCLSFMVLVAALGLIVKFVKVILDKIVKVQWHPVIEKFGGLFVGMLKAYLITAMVLTMFAMIPLPYLQWSVKERSLTGKYILLAGPETRSKLEHFFPENTSGRGRTR